MQVIRTRYLPPRGAQGCRIATNAEAGTVTSAWDYGIGTTENHRAAAERYRDIKGWKGELCGGQHGNDYYWVFVEDKKQP